MSRVLVICCDGTWNKPEQKGGPTNVTKMTRAVPPRAPDGTQQLVYYDQGVGTGGKLDRFLGGTLGIGLEDNVQEAYRFLALNFEPGDRLAMFGFSRGAYTVRSLAGLVSLVGLLRKGDLDKMEKVWNYYRTKPEDRRADALQTDWIADRRPDIDLLGVWDTVGALGIPGNGLGRLSRRKHEFHDVTLGRKVRRAFQALAVDERRATFEPAIWDTRNATPDQVVEQVWFAGAHSNIGGGYPDATLSDQAFLWMVDKARALLAFDEDYLARRARRLGDEEASGAAIDPSQGWWRLVGRKLRTIGTDPSETLHPSVLVRMGVRGPFAAGQAPPFTPHPYDPPNVRDYLSRRN